MTDGAEPLRIRAVLWRFGPMIYGPTLLFSLGEGALIPLLPFFAHRLGADVAASAAVASALVVGQLVGNIPAGWAVARFGERPTMAVGGGATILGITGMLIAPDLIVLTLAVLLLGFTAAIFALARQAFMTVRVPLSFRARALSLLGGAFRLGTFVGPFVAALLLAIFHTEDAAIWFALACSAGVVAMVLLGPDPEWDASQALNRAADAGPASKEDALELEGEDSGEAVAGTIPADGRRLPRGLGAFETLWRHRAVLSRLGVAAASLSAIRAARQVVLPLWGVSLGLDAQTISLVVGISGAIDFALFYASGQVMDRFGRLWAALPAMLLMGAAFFALAFTHGSTQAEMWFAMFAAVLGVGNGLSSGILLTLGADVAPQSDPAPFLGTWRTLTDAGGAIAPLLVSAITALSTLPIATGAMGVLGLLGAFGFIRWVPRFVPRKST